MDTVYNTANAASKAIFGEGNKNTQSRNPNSVTTDNERPSNEKNPFRHSDTTSTTRPYDSNSAGFGSQHTAASTSDSSYNKPELSKPAVTFATGTGYDSGAVNPNTSVGSHQRSYDEPSSNDFDKPSTAGVFGEQSSNFTNTPASNFDKPITTTSTFQKSSVGDLNKDGTRHETSDLENLDRGTHDRDNSPTISSIHKDSDKPLSSRFTEGTTDTTDTTSYTHNKPSTTSYGEHEHMKDPTHFDKPDTHSFGKHPTSTSHGTGAFTSGVGTSHEHHTPSSTDFSKPTDNSKPTTDSQQTPHNQPSTNIQSLIDPKPTTTGAENSGFETSNAAPKSLAGTTGSGPATAVEPSVGAHPGHAQQETQKQQGADRPLEDPASEDKTLEKRNDDDKRNGDDKRNDDCKDKGTGELYEKSTGVAAEGGDFDASRPGAGREADRLLDQEGIHHGADLKPDTKDITAGNSKLLGGHKEKPAEKPDHGKTTQSSGKPDGAAETGHKGLSEKIKEKLHIGHH